MFLGESPGSHERPAQRAIGRAGFKLLIELLVVMLILGLLAVIAILVFFKREGQGEGCRRKGRRPNCAPRDPDRTRPTPVVDMVRMPPTYGTSSPP